MLWCAPRRPRSGWSALNKRLIAGLEDEGRREAAGRAAIAAAQADGSSTLLDDVERGVVPDDLATAFDERPGARTTWDDFRGPRTARCSSGSSPPGVGTPATAGSRASSTRPPRESGRWGSRLLASGVQWMTDGTDWASSCAACTTGSGPA